MTVPVQLLLQPAPFPAEPPPASGAALTALGQDAFRAYAARHVFPTILYPHPFHPFLSLRRNFNESICYMQLAKYLCAPIHTSLSAMRTSTCQVAWSQKTGVPQPCARSLKIGFKRDTAMSTPQNQAYIGGQPITA